MFTPIGKRSQMLKNLIRSESTGSSIVEVIRKEQIQLTKTLSLPNETILLNNMNKKINKDVKCLNHEELKNMLESNSIAGNAIRKLSQAAIRFRKDRDAIQIRAFETSSLDINNFRILLKRIFFAEFNEEEFVEVIDLFDPNRLGVVNGSDFLTCFTILSTTLRNKQREFQIELINKKKSLDNKLEQDRVNFKLQHEYTDFDMNFSETDKLNAYTGLAKAARKSLITLIYVTVIIVLIDMCLSCILFFASDFYDKSHHSAKSLKGFEVKYLAPKSFRVLLKNTLALDFTPKELGAIIYRYNGNTIDGDLRTTEFIVDFLRMGLESRMVERSKQIVKSRTSIEVEQEKHETKSRMQLEALDVEPDFKFTELERDELFDKLRLIAAGYDKHHPSAVSLQGFNGNYLSPGFFKDTMKRTFNIDLTPKDLGILLTRFDIDKINKIHNHEFLVYFVRTGNEERSKVWSSQITKIRIEEEIKKEEEARLLNAKWRQKDLDFLALGPNPELLRTAMTKISDVAQGYHPGSGYLNLNVFNGGEMGPSEFIEMLKRCMYITLSYEEVAALMPSMGVVGKRDKIDSGIFCNKFKYIAARSRQARHRKQIAMEKEKDRLLKEEHKKRLAKEYSENLHAVDYNFSPEDAQTGFNKLTVAAGLYDRNHPGCMNLSGFDGLNMSPLYFGRMLWTTFHVDLTAKELGAVVKKFDANGDGEISSQEFLTAFFHFQKAHRDNVRTAQVEKTLKRKQKVANHHKMVMNEMYNEQKKKYEYKPEDKVTLLSKLKRVAKLFAVDK